MESSLPQNITTAAAKNKQFKESGSEIPHIWTTFSQSLPQRQKAGFLPPESPLKNEAFFATESDKEEDDDEEEDDKTWSTVSLSSSPRVLSEVGIQGWHNLLSRYVGPFSFFRVEPEFQRCLVQKLRRIFQV